MIDHFILEPNDAYNGVAVVTCKTRHPRLPGLQGWLFGKRQPCTCMSRVRFPTKIQFSRAFVLINAELAIKEVDYVPDGEYIAVHVGNGDRVKLYDRGR